MLLLITCPLGRLARVNFDANVERLGPNEGQMCVFICVLHFLGGTLSLADALETSRGGGGPLWRTQVPVMATLAASLIAASHRGC